MSAAPLDAAARLPLGDTLDVRAAPEFRVGHFASAASCPLADLPGSLHLLPPREAPFWVFGDDDEVSAALALLREHGYERVAAHPATAPGAAPFAPVASPWISGEGRVRLWQPASFLAEILGDPQAPQPPGLALDVACGTGRNACYLALSGPTHWCGPEAWPTRRRWRPRRTPPPASSGVPGDGASRRLRRRWL
jgi:hypothetical protein